MNALAQPQDCCRPCETPTTVSVPGPEGERGTQWTSGAGAPDDSVGENGDFYVNTTTGGIYKRIAGVYVLQFTTIGTDGTSVTVYQQPAEPMAAIAGDIWISPTDVQVKQPDLTWVSIVGPAGPAGGTVTTTKGDLITDDGAASPAASPVRLGVGAAGQTLHSKVAFPYGIGWATFDMSGAASAITGSVPIANGGTGSATAANARTALGLAIGTNVQAYDAFLTSIALLGTAADKMIYTTGVDTAAEAAITSVARTLLAQATVVLQRSVLGKVLPRYGLLCEKLSFDVNSAGSDNAMTVEASRYRIDRITVDNGSINLTTATAGVFSGAGGGGVTVAAAQSLAALTTSTKFDDLTLDAGIGTDVLTSATLYARCDVAQGAAATCDLRIFGWRFD